PWSYLFNEARTLFLIKLMSPIVFICLNSYLLSSVVIATLSFIGVWKLYRLIVSYYPQYQKEIAIGLMFVPTVIFWGSGMLKDTITLSSFCWFVLGFEGFFIKRKNLIKNAIVFLISGYFILSIKPYILMAATPGMITWLLYAPVNRISNRLLKYITIPFILVASISLGVVLISSFGDRLGKFSLENIIETAAVTQDDLKRDYYKGSSFDIGKFEATPAGILSKAPEAISAGLFRPFIWESRNITTFLSGIENIFILGLVILTLIKMKIIGLFKYLFDHPLLLFFFLYSLLFAFSIGISTSNFGALIRFKIAFAPFFITLFLVLFRLSGKKYSKPNS
ncbi:MAG: hypothetical protein ACK452_05940, partial [Bacteroidota bacterium]